MCLSLSCIAIHTRVYSLKPLLWCSEVQKLVPIQFFFPIQFQYFHILYIYTVLYSFILLERYFYVTFTISSIGLLLILKRTIQQISVHFGLIRSNQFKAFCIKRAKVQGHRTTYLYNLSFPIPLVRIQIEKSIKL